MDFERGGASAVGAGAVHDDAEACDKMSMSRATDDPIYLDNAGTSHPKPDAVLSAASKALRTAPTSDGEWYDECLAFLARHLGVSPQRLLPCGSCTQALDVAISHLPWRQGDVIVSSQLEHHALCAPARRLVRQVGVEHHLCPYTDDSPLDLRFLESQLRTGRVRLVAVTTASNVSGEQLPIPTIVDLAHAHGALVLADGAQTFGLVDDDVPSLGCDMFTFSGHKHALGPRGIGGLWAAEHVQFDDAATPRALDEHGSAVGTLPGCCDVGGTNRGALAGLVAGLDAFGEERSERMRNARSLATELARLLGQVRDVKVFGHRGGLQTATVSFVHERLPINRAEAYFRSRDLVVRAGHHCAPDALQALGAPDGTVRISFGPTNTERDMKAAAVAVLEL